MREPAGAVGTASDSPESTPTRRLALFLVVTAAGGAGALGGSIIGHTLGPFGLRVGATLGGVLGVVLATTFARRRLWLQPRSYVAATAGGVIGFLLAASIAVATLNSSVGPVSATLLIGVGALAGDAYSARRASGSSPR